MRVQQQPYFLPHRLHRSHIYCIRGLDCYLYIYDSVFCTLLYINARRYLPVPILIRIWEQLDGYISYVHYVYHSVVDCGYTSSKIISLSILKCDILGPVCVQCVPLAVHEVIKMMQAYVLLRRKLCVMCSLLNKKNIRIIEGCILPYFLRQSTKYHINVLSKESYID